MADPAFYNRDPGGFQKTADDIAALRDKLTAMEEEWLELEAKREALSG